MATPLKIRSARNIPVLDWQPIQTAPKTGERILLYRRGWMESMAVGFWSRHYGDWAPVAGGSVFPGPTHWMQLPEPPTQED